MIKTALALSASALFAAAACAAPEPAQKKAPVAPRTAAKASTASKAAAQQSKLIPVDRIAAVVNNDIITGLELQQRVHQTALNLRRQRIPLPPMEDLRKQVLERMIIDRIIEQRARDAGIRIDDNMLNAAVEQIAKNNGTTVAGLEKKLADDGVTFDAFKNNLKTEILSQRLREREVYDRIQIPDSEVEQYLKDQSAPNKRREFKLARIVIPLPEGASREELQQIQKKAKLAYEQADKGISFKQLAAHYSSAPDAMQGGDMGWVPAARLPSFILDAIGDHYAGDIVSITTPNSYQIYKVEDVRDPGAPSAELTMQTHVRHILLRPTDVSSEEDIKKRLSTLRKQLETGEQDFTTLARLHSADPTGTKGGDMGWVYGEDIPPEMRDVLDKLSIGEISAPTKTPMGWHIFQVLNRRMISGVNEKMRREAYQDLKEQKAQDAIMDWERRLTSSAYIEDRTTKTPEQN